MHYLFLLLLVLSVSPAFLFVKLALHGLSPLGITFMRVFLAALLFCIMIPLFNRQWPKKLSFWGFAFWQILIACILPTYFYSLAEEKIESVLAALINGTTPLFTALIAHWWVPDDRLNRMKVLGISLSFFGLIFLFLPQLLGGVMYSWEGLLWAFGGSFCFACSHTFAKRNMSGYPLFVAPAAQFITGTLFLLPAMAFSTLPTELWELSLSAWYGILGIGLFSTFLGYTFYYILIERVGPTAVSMAVCFFPLVSFILGYLFLGEILPPTAFIALLFVVTGALLVCRKPTPTYLEKPT